MKKTYQYKVIDISVNDDANNIDEDYLNQLGSDGWKLINVERNPIGEREIVGVFIREV